MEMRLLEFQVKTLKGGREEDKQVILALASSDKSVTVHLPSISATATATAQATFNRSQTLPDLQDILATFRDVSDPEFQAARVALDRISPTADKEKMIESGALPKIIRFLDGALDAGKKAGDAHNWIENAQKLGAVYNSVAPWCGLPVVPKPLLGKHG